MIFSACSFFLAHAAFLLRLILRRVSSDRFTPKFRPLCFAFVLSVAFLPKLANLNFSLCASDNDFPAFASDNFCKDSFFQILDLDDSAILARPSMVNDEGLPFWALLILARPASEILRPFNEALRLALCLSENIRPFKALLNLSFVSSEVLLPFLARLSFARYSFDRLVIQHMLHEGRPLHEASTSQVLGYLAKLWQHDVVLRTWEPDPRDSTSTRANSKTLVARGKFSI